MRALKRTANLADPLSSRPVEIFDPSSPEGGEKMAASLGNLAQNKGC
jgi:hypothetical protein